MNMLRYLVLMILVAVTTACIQLGGPAPPNQYFILESIAKSTSIFSSNNLVVTIELIEFPEHLKRPQVVVQRQENIIYFSDNQRWATPLEGQILALLTSNLELLLPQATVKISPWHNNRDDDYKLQLAVKKLSGTLGHHSTIDIRWNIVGKDGDKRTGQYLNQRSIGDSYEELVRALNQGLEGLSRELAVEITKPGQ